MVPECGHALPAYFASSPDASTLDVAGGMDIIRHLKIPKNFHGTLTTLFMAVQGKLTMYSTKLVTDTVSALNRLNIVLPGFFCMEEMR
eukprot:15366417-Ditylum_brightwellii.AAC.3